MRIQELFESKIFNEENLTRGKLAAQNGVFLEVLIQMVEDEEPLDVDPAYRNKYGNTIIMDPAMLPAMRKSLSNPEFIATTLPETFSIIDEQGNSVPGIPWGALFKSSKFTPESKSYNAGHISELFMGVAVTAKFIHAGELNDREAVFKTLKTLVKSATVVGKNYQFSLAKKIKMQDKPVSDQLKFTAIVPSRSAESLIEQVKSNKLAPDLEALFNSAIRYTNESKNIADAVDRVKTQTQQSIIEVNSDGTREGKRTKADMTLLIDGEKISLISLKTYSTTTLGQISGISYEQLNRWFDMSFGISISKYKDLLDPTLPRDDIYQNLLEEIYDEYVYPEVVKKVENQKPNKEAEIIKKLAYSAKFHALGEHMEDIEIVKLNDQISSGGYKVLRFSNDLEDAMKKFDLEVKYLSKGNSRTIQIWVKPGKDSKAGKGNKDMLCQFRTAKMGRKYGNYFEIGPILEKLTQQTIPAAGKEKDANKVTPPTKPIKARFEPKGSIGRQSR